MSLSLAAPSRIAAGLGWPRSVHWTGSLGWPGDLPVPRETAPGDHAVEPASRILVDRIDAENASVDRDFAEDARTVADDESPGSAGSYPSPASGPDQLASDHASVTALREHDRVEMDHHEDRGPDLDDAAGVDAADVDAEASDDRIEFGSPVTAVRSEPQAEDPPRAAPVPRETVSSAQSLVGSVARSYATPEVMSPAGTAEATPEADVSRETPGAGGRAGTAAVAGVSRPPGPRRARFDRDEFDTGEVAEPPAPNPLRPPPPSANTPMLPKPRTTRVFVVANQKGGVGKTTTSVNLAAGLALGGLNVLVLDLDPQGNASTALGIDHSPGVPGTYEVLIEGSPIANHLVASPEAPNLHVLPATIDLAGAEIQLVSMVARENRLRKALRAYLTDHPVDYVFLDCPPSLGLITLNALVAASEILIPIQCEYYALEGVSQLVRTINLVKGELNEDLAVSTVLLTMFDARTRLAAQVADEVRAYFTEETLPTVIPRSVRISEAPSYGQTVLTYHPDSAGAVSYLQAAQEIARRGAADEQ